ncbi:MAG: glutamate formimidoyltransferase [Methanomassiliicoccales archaeon]|jgi:glutamate formiminotransferase/formiminotetrahydrofolate cyclodeaminase
MAIVECVPNFSEGRRRDVIDAIVEAMRKGGEAKLLDVRSDPDHNRFQVSMVGELEEVYSSTMAGVAKAIELIDMEKHKGEHPRIGAADVVPFVPVSGITLQECVSLAKKFAEEVATKFDIPVYLYEAAAIRPERRDLAYLRRGEYEGLKASITTDPDRAPDFGPRLMGKAGATAVGAREFLIAFNAYLNTSDVRIAKMIAKTVRERDGGLPFVKAMGFETKPNVQVSMNLTDFRKTPVHVVLERVEDEAAKSRTRVTETEIFGMVPEDALLDAAEEELLLKGKWSRDLIIERRIAALSIDERVLRKMRLDMFLQELASASPAPGGGSASCLMGAMGAALGAMVCRLSIGKKGLEDLAPMFERKAAELDALRLQLTRAMDEDASAFDEVMAAFRLPKGTEEEKASRSAAIQAAYRKAAEVPLSTASRCRQVIEILVDVGPRSNPSARSDIAVGLRAARAGLDGATENVLVNLQSITDETFVDEVRIKLDKLRLSLDELMATVLPR